MDTMTNRPPIDLVQKLNFQVDLELALTTLNEVRASYTLDHEFRQLNFVHTQPKMKSVYDGTGTIFDHSRKEWKFHEHDFGHFAEEFKDTYFYRIYEDLSAHLNCKLARTRLMLIPAKACYSVHRDPTIRFHLPLITNPQALMIFRVGQVHHMPAVGDAFVADTRYYHTAMNGGTEDRIHLVFSKARN